MDRINERLSRARDRYKTKLIRSLDELEELLRAEPLAGEGLAEAQRLAHRLYGSAGTFGFSGVSEAVGAIDRDLLDLLSARREATPELWQRLQRRALEARELANRG